MKLLVSGPEWIDIDAYACIVAYGDFLQNQKKEIVKCLLNISYSPTITKSLLDLPLPELKIVNSYSNEDNLVLLDISGRTYIERFYNINNIIELWDHRKGHEIYRKELLQDKSHIELVGSCTTLIYEHIKQYGKLEYLHDTSLLLLYAGTISNTLNLQSSVTTDRDKTCCKALQYYLNIPDTWAEHYFKDIQSMLTSNIPLYLSLETKYESFLGAETMIVQCELRDSKLFIQKKLQDLQDYIASGKTSSYGFFTSPSVKENCNYIVCSDIVLQKKISNIINIHFDGIVGKTDKIRLRKELLSLSNLSL